MGNNLSKIWSKIKSGAKKAKDWVVDKWNKTPETVKYIFSPYMAYKTAEVVTNGVKTYIEKKQLQNKGVQDNSIRGIAIKEYGGVPVWVLAIAGIGAGILIFK